MSIVLDGTTGITTPGLTNTGTETVVNLTTTGNTILGDASTDTLNVGNGGLVKDASGNVGIGTSSPTYKIQAEGSTPAYFGVNSTSGTQIGYAAALPTNSLNCYVGWIPDSVGTGGVNGDLALQPRTSAGANIRFFTGSTSATERMRIDSSGNLLVGTTSALGLVSAVGTATTNIMVLKDTGTTYGSGSWYIGFHNSSGATAGAIQHTAVTTVNYATTSDARLKTNKGIATDTSVIDNIIIRDFEWKEDGRIDRGVFAQEAHEIKPFAVGVGDDEITESGHLKNPWNVDYSKFVPDLIVHAQQLKKQVQEQQAIITQLQADVAVLKGTP